MPNQGGTHEQPMKSGQQGNKNEQQHERQAAPGKKDDSQQQRGGSGNFAQDRERASEAGRKGGKH